MDASQVVTCKALSLAYWRITGEASSIGVPLRFLSTKKIKGTMKYEEIENKVQSYRWLEGIAEEYRAMIDRINAEQEYFRVEKIAYTARGDMQYLDLNCHRTIPGHYIADGLKEALIGIDEEIKQLKAELEAINIEL
jgi:hypothetical protein